VDASPVGGNFFQADPTFAWSEGLATWNNAPPIVGTSLGTLGTVKVGTWYEVDLSSLVQGNDTYSLRITTSATNGADYATKERPGALGPRLVVTVGP
jgi:hypothetical protein